MGLIEITQRGVLRPSATRKRSSIGAYQLSDLARLFEDFAFAIVRPNPNAEAPSFFGFKDSIVPSKADAAFFMSRFSRRAAVLLENFQEWSAGRGPGRSEQLKKQAIRVGMGVYLLRSDYSFTPDTASNAGGRPRARPARNRNGQSTS